MSANQKPTLGGTRIKQRKRNVQHKYEPEQFLAAVTEEFEEAAGDFEVLTKKLTTNTALDFNRYGETFLDCFLAGGIIQPGGKVLYAEGREEMVYCVFKAEDEDIVRKWVTLLQQLLRRKPFLRPVSEAALQKSVQYLQYLEAKELDNFGMFVGLFLSAGIIPATFVNQLGEIPALSASGVALAFCTKVFKWFLSEESVEKLASSLVTAKTDDAMLSILPPGKRNPSAFQAHFEGEGMKEFASFFVRRMIDRLTASVTDQIGELMDADVPIKELSEFVSKQVEDNSLPPHEAVNLVFESVVSSIPWTKKSSQNGQVALQHVKAYAKLIASFTTKRKAEKALILKVQENCYDETRLLKYFAHLIRILYDEDALSEETIFWWTKQKTNPKGMQEFSEQMEPFIKWLEEADEESD